MTYRVFIVDDEHLARERLKRLLQKHEAFAVCGEAEHGEAALLWLQENTADIMLLDIQMPGTNGLVVAKQVRQLKNPPVIIFCTAYDEYALEAFRVQALDYLLKPVRPEELTAALNRAVDWLSSLTGSQTEKERTHLSANTHKGLERIAVVDIIACLAEQKYVSVLYENGRVLVDESLKQLEEEFPSVFIRTHRSALVAKDRLHLLQSHPSGHQLLLHGLEQAIPVSRRHLAKVKEAMES